MCPLQKERRASSISLPFLQDLRDMTELSLQNNPLSELHGFALAGMRNVTNVYLGYNRIARIDG